MAIVFHYLLPLQKRVLQKHNNSLSPVELSFCKRWNGLPSVNFSYDTSLHFQQPSETKSEELRNSYAAGSALDLCSSYYIMLTTHSWWRRLSVCQVKYTHGRFSCGSSLTHSICPLRRLREEKKERFFLLVCYHWSSSPENCSVK